MKNIDAKIVMFCFAIVLSVGMRKSQSQTPKVFFPDYVEIAFTTTDFFTFMWTDTNLIYAPYQFALYRAKDTIPIYSATGIKEYYVNYPWNAPPLETDSYVWSVTSMSGNWSGTGYFYIHPQALKLSLFRAKNQYTELRERLDGSYQYAFDKWLYFHYSQFYITQGNQGLRFVIRDESHNEIIRTNEYGVPDGSCPVPVVPISYKENYLVLKLDQCPEIEYYKYYYLDVWNEKDEHLYLRFQCRPSSPVARIVPLN
jgi:hypothetical protein